MATKFTLKIFLVQRFPDGNLPLTKHSISSAYAVKANIRKEFESFAFGVIKLSVDS